MARRGRRGRGVDWYRGRWRARVWLVGAEKSRVFPGTDEGYRDAAAWRAAMLAQIRDQSAELPGAVTVAEFGAQWLARREVGGQIRGIRQELARWRRHIAPSAIGALPLKRLTRQMIVRWLRGKSFEEAVSAISTKQGVKLRGLGRPLAPKSLRLILGTLSSCLRDAADEGHLPANVAAGIRVRASR